METKTAVTKWKRRWTLKRELREQEGSIETLKVGDATYKPTLDAVEQISKMRREKAESRVRILKDIVTAGVCIFVAAAAYSVDKSDDLLRNKSSAGVFSKIFHP